MMLEILTLLGGLIALLWLYACAMCLLFSLQSFLKARHDRTTETSSQCPSRNECPADGAGRHW